jgi:hypothetical protein
MNLIFSLPRGKEVVTEEFLYKHVKELFQDTSLSNKVKILEKFIITKNLNVIEKFIALLKLRQKCISPDVTLSIDDKNVDVNIDVILESFEEILNIREEKTINNITVVLDYPTRFCVDTDNILSVIHEVQFKDEKINLNTVTDDEFLQITNSLPADVLTLIYKFVEKRKDALNFTLFNKIELSFLNASSFVFLSTIFECIDDFKFREYLFVLSRRIKDVNFLLNCTLIEINDYMELYRRENDEENQKLKN